MPAPKHLLTFSDYEYTPDQVRQAFAALKAAGNDLEAKSAILILAVQGSPDHEIEAVGGSAHEARLILAKLPFIDGQDNVEGRIIALRRAMGKAIAARLKTN